MYQHHKDSVVKFQDYFSNREDIIALIFGGSVAKGEEREDSDIDGMVILNDEAYEKYKEEEHFTDAIFGEATYEGGYFDVKYMNKDFLKLAAQQGSDPTRSSFVKSQILFSKDEEIEKIIEDIKIYPTKEKQERMELFMSILMLNYYYFFDLGVLENDSYILNRSCTDMVYGGMRMLLTYNEKFFPCHRKMMRYVDKLENKPENIVELGNNLIKNQDKESKEIYFNAIMSFADWGVDFSNPGKFASIYAKRLEQTWTNSNDNVYEL